MDALTVEHLAAMLQEPNVPLLQQVFVALGPDRTAALLAATLEVEAHGGMLVRNGTRRRTPGGVFFQLVRAHPTRRQRDARFPRPAPHPSGAAPAQPQKLTWDEVQPMLEMLGTTPVGEARTIKLTLIDRPGHVEARGQAMVFRMQGRPPGSLPRGLPPVPATASMTWNVMAALRQWNRVKDSPATHPEDQLIIEGSPLMQGSQHVLLAQSCVSMSQQQAQKQVQQQYAQEQAPPASH